jgi:hypothetical protein
MCNWTSREVAIWLSSHEYASGRMNLAETPFCRHAVSPRGWFSAKGTFPGRALKVINHEPTRTSTTKLPPLRDVERGVFRLWTRTSRPARGPLGLSQCVSPTLSGSTAHIGRGLCEIGSNAQLQSATHPMALALNLWPNTSWPSPRAWPWKLATVRVVDNSGESSRLLCRLGQVG